MSRHLILIRHGESKMNAANGECPTYCGQTETPLTDKGRQQASLVGDTLAKRTDLPIQHAVSSDLDRAVETLQIIVGRLPKVVGVMSASPDLRERSLGRFEGCTEEDVFQKYPAYRNDPQYQHFRFHATQKAPGGENLTEVAERAWPRINELLNETTGSLLMVSHSTTIRCILATVQGIPFEEAEKIPHARPIILLCSDGPRERKLIRQE